MKIIEKPKVLLLAQTQVSRNGIAELVNEAGAPEFQTDQPGGSGELAEVAGRLCYKSFAPGVNPNVTKVREGNQPYLKNIIKQKHGSVLEHGSASIGFLGVSRVFTHELVRHRAGAAFSQESLRYVRLSELIAYYPDAFKAGTLQQLAENLDANILGEASERWEDGGKEDWVLGMDAFLRQKFIDVFEYLEGVQKDISSALHLDDVKNFHVKKKITSAMRRLAPIGLGTNIICTANHRAWRHMIETRTAPGAEEEIRKVFVEVYQILSKNNPNIYQDAQLTFEDGEAQVIFENSKI